VAPRTLARIRDRLGPLGRARRAVRPAHALIVSPRRSTVIARDGGVRSAQLAKLTMDADDLERLWIKPNLENLARTYWRFLSRVTLGLIRVVYDQDSRSVVLLIRPLTLLRFDPPEYEAEHDRGRITWPIRGGLLVARAGRRSGGFLRIDARRLTGPDAAPAGQGAVKIEVEVANFYPSIAAGLSTPVYEMTQSALHVLVTHAFLRSLANLDLAQSKIGSLLP
jgi:hypothetical protein